MYNRVILIGRVVRDPELRYTPRGVAVAQFDLAVDRPPGQNGEKKADFLRIVVWRKQAEVCANNLGKGRLVAVEGSLRTRSYEDRNGAKRRVTEVVAGTVKFLDRPKAGANAADDDIPELEDLDSLDDLLPGDDLI
ncbi:MAG: single-stranded DNA-binding protein [Moorellales bacterium]